MSYHQLSLPQFNKDCQPMQRFYKDHWTK
jgi:hypothetical protein